MSMSEEHKLMSAHAGNFGVREREYLAGPNEKLLWRLFRTANDLFDHCLPETSRFTTLAHQLIACRAVTECYERFVEIREANKELLGEVPEKFVEDYAKLQSNMLRVKDHYSVLKDRVRYLSEILYGELVSDEPMSHETMMEFLGSLKPNVEEPNPISIHSTPHEKPNPFYDPAKPLANQDTFKGEKILWEPDTDEPQVTGNEIDTPIQMKHDGGDLPSVDPESAD